MCYAVYIGTAEKQKADEWKEGETLLYFNQLSETDKIVKTKFTKPFIYYVGADTGCSCGFAWEIEYFNDPEEQKSKRSPQKLIDFINAQTKKEDLEFYCCWEGDWSEPVLESIKIHISDVSLEKYYFMEEKRFVLFQRQQ